MRLFAAFLLCSITAASLAQGISCRPLEYAEIKDTATKQLIEIYCEYGNSAMVNRQLQEQQQERFLKAIKENPNLVWGLEPQFRRLESQLNATASDCSAQQAKIATALKARPKKVVDLTCKTP